MTDPLLEESDIIPISEIEGISTEHVTSDDLQEITSLGKSLKDVNNNITAKEAEVSQLKAVQKQITEELIPDLMAKNGLKLIQLDDGAKIQINDFVDARIKDPSIAFDWLRDTNNDSIIKNQITIAPLAADKVKTNPQNFYIDITIKGQTSRSPQTFKAKEVWPQIYKYYLHYYEKYRK